MTLEERVREDRRLCVLRLLAEDADYTLNTSILQSALTDLGHGIARDVVESDAAWLEEQGLVSRESLGGGKVIVVRLLGRGLDVAQGKATVPGVKRPRPGG
ncbi:hypothetical protein [Pararhodospirillum photometricum]|uniref:ArsR family transcriptional regulator n=1 Tax=Pararhodospirillum photometricum DSM 122 TaxID=1150469 RepID=H6SQM8_PARPM|nr:hypothetical protein [Pararhodospirillum photometricum]CCG07343.1 Putative uncharacterized protein [Pararhodospirillum photometricum DSM 122]